MEEISTNAKPKEPWVAVLLNQLFPGIGYFYAEAKNKGWIFTLGIATFYFIIIFYIVKISLNPDLNLLSFLPGLIILGLFDLILRIAIFVDSYRTVKKYNHSHGFAKVNTALRIFTIIGFFLFLFFSPTPILTALFVRTNFLQVYKIPTTSMIPTLKPGDKIVTDKTIYKKALPRRGDVVVFIPPHDRRRAYVHRVIGLPNEILEIKNGDIYINDAKISDKRIAGNHYYNSGIYGKENEKILIPTKSYFLMGDNSANSHDSRYFGFVPLKDIKSKVIKIFYPPERAGKVE